MDLPAPEYGAWKRLLGVIKSASKHGQAEWAEELLMQLDSYQARDHFLAPLHFHEQKQGSTSRTEVQSGTLHFPEASFNLNQEYMAHVLKVADSLQVDEKYAFVLSQKTFDMLEKGNYAGIAPSTIAEYLYYEERKYQLLCICELLKLCCDLDADEPIRYHVRGFFEDVGVEKLTITLITSLQRHVEVHKIQAPDTQTNTQLKQQHVAEEMLLLNTAIFYTLHSFPTTILIVNNILEFLLLLTSKMRLPQIEPKQDFFLESPGQIYDIHLFKVASGLYMSLINLLLHGIIDEPTATSLFVSSQLAQDKDNNTRIKPQCGIIRSEDVRSLDARFMAFLDNYQPVFFHCAVLFGYIIYFGHIHNNTNTLPTILSKMSTALLGEPGAVDTVVTILAEDALFFIGQMLSASPSKHYEHTMKPRAFYSLFRFWACDFKASPQCGTLFWSDDHRFSYLLKTTDRQLFANEKFGVQIWHNFLELLTNSVHVAESAYQAYLFYDKLPRSLNWDHIFKCLAAYVTDYYPNLYAPYGMTSSGSTPARPLSPSDVKSWENIFSFMSAILRHNETIRGLISDNPNWQAIGTLFQFLMCPIPISLKAKMISVIAAFAKSERLAATIWELLDQSELVPLVTANLNQLSLSKKREGLLYELISTESVQMEYPLTRSFLSLIIELIKWPLPTALGMSRRVSPTITVPNAPNPNSLYNSHANSSGFVTPGAIGLQPYISYICNEIFVKFSSRGYRNLEEMWTVATECLSIISSLLKNYKYKDQDAAENYTDVNGRSSLLPKPPALLLIRDISSGSDLYKIITYIIDQGATKLFADNELSAKHVEIFEKAVETSMKVLTSVFGHMHTSNLRLNLGQQMVSEMNGNVCAISLAKLIAYKSSSKIPLLAVELLSCLTKTQYGLARLFHGHIDSAKLVDALASQLENTDIEFDKSENLMTQKAVQLVNKSQEERGGTLKLVITRFLLENIDREKPNITQFYLGFMSDFGTPDLMKNQCLNAILARVNDPAEFLSLEPQLGEAFYELIYKLCADVETYEVMMDFLRDPKHDFFIGQLRRIPVGFPSSLVNATFEIYARAWFLKALAIELRVMAGYHQSYVKQLLDELFAAAPEEGNVMLISQRVAAQRVMLQFLLALDYAPNELQPPQLQYFPSISNDNAVLPNYHGVPITNLPIMFDILVNEKNSRNPNQVLPAVTTPLSSSISMALVPAKDDGAVDEEIYDILNYYRQLNLNENLSHAKVFFYSAWKQVVDVVVCSCAELFTPLETREAIVYELLESILTRATHASATPYISNMASTITILINRLKQDKPMAVSLNDYEVKGKYHLPAARLQRIFRNLLQTLLRPGSSRVLRGHLYTAIIDYFTITEIQPDISLLASHEDLNGKAWFLEDIQNHYKRTIQDNYEILREFGFGTILDLVSADAAGTGGYDPWRTVALALLDKVLRYDDKTRTDISKYLDERGFLRSFLDFENIGTGSSGLVKVLSSATDIYPEVFLYQSKMQFLQRMGGTLDGASLLWSNFIMEKIINCQFIDFVPDEREGTNKPYLRERYNSLAVPFLDLCIALLLTLRRNAEFVGEFAIFVERHSETLSQLMRDRSLSSETLQLVTSVFYLLAEQPEILSQKLKSKQTRFHTQLLQILCRFREKEVWPAYKMANSPAKLNDNMLDVLFNLLSYCMTAILRGNPNVIFSPSFNIDSLAMEASMKGPIPPLSALGYIISNVIAQYDDIVADMSTTRQHLYQDANLSTIPEHYLTELDPEFVQTINFMSLEEREVKIKDLLSSHLASRDAQATKLFKLALSLMWRHLEYYLHPTKQAYQNLYTSTMTKYDPNAASTLHANEIEQLRANARAYLYNNRSTNSLLNKATSIGQLKKGNHIDHVVQKIKELLRDPIVINR